MRLRVKHYLVGLAFLTLTMPLYARTYKYSATLSNNTTIGNAKLRPGSYEFVADDTKKELNILQKGKIIATVQGEWVKILGKSPEQGLILITTRLLKCGSVEATKHSNFRNPKNSTKESEGGLCR